jgi:hypothetical protein
MFSLECPTSQNAINMKNYKSLMSAVRGILAVAAEWHPVGARVEWAAAKGAAIYARYFMSCSLYREEIIVVFRVTVSLLKWKCSSLTSLSYSPGHAFVF